LAYCCSKIITEVLDWEQEKQEVINYGLVVLMNNTLALVIVLSIAYVIKAFAPTVAMVVTLMLLRPSAGGAHCNSIFNCNLFGIVFVPLFSYGAVLFLKSPAILIYLYMGLSVLIALIGIVANAPYFTQKKPRAEVKSKTLKVRAIITLALASIVTTVLLFFDKANWSIGISNGLLFQGFMLLPLGIRCTHTVDLFITKLVDRM
jgi:accessory gene regulator B